MKIVAFVPDLMDRSRFGSAADRAAEVVFVTRSQDLAGIAAAGANLVVLDLGRAGVLEVVPEITALGIEMLGFASHVDDATIAAARAAGVGEVLPRSRFFARLPALLTGA